MTSSIRIFKESAKALFAHLQTLLAGGIGHTHDGAPKIEGIGYVGGNGEQNEEDEVYWVSQHCNMSVIKVIATH